MTPRLTLLMAVCTGLAVANIYYNQPMLGLIAAELGPHAAQVPAATQLGYASGIFLLVPLGDRIDRRRLILWQAFSLLAALAAAAVAPTALTLAAASMAIGIGASLAQQILPFAAELAPPEQRGRIVGTIMSGLLAGILLARTLSGAVADLVGWRPMFWLGVILAGLMAALLAAFLPHSEPASRLSYPALMRSLASMPARYRSLRRATFVQACLFGGFSAFWSTLALFLQGPPHHLGPAIAGLFGVIGLVGIAAAPLGGRLSDRRGPGAVAGVGIALVIVSFILLAAWPTLAGLAIGVVLMDAGVQATMVSNQTVIFAINAAERSRINTVFVTGIFLGGAIGSSGAAFLWHAPPTQLSGWTAVCAMSALFAIAALIVQARGTRHAG